MDRDERHKLLALRTEVVRSDDKLRELANVTSERDYLRERLRELVSEMETEAARVTAEAGHQAIGHPGRANQARLIGVAGGLNNAADRIACIVNESEHGDNRTATREAHDGT